MAKEAAAKVRTMGVALTPCIVPAVGRPTFTLPNDGEILLLSTISLKFFFNLHIVYIEVEFGLGIHGEAGIKRQNLQTVDLVVDQLITSILNDAKVSLTF